METTYERDLVLRSRKVTVEQALKDQERLLVAIAAGLDRTAALEEEYQTRARALTVALDHFRMVNPFPYPSLAAWVAELKLTRADLPTCRQYLAEASAQVRQGLGAFA